MDALNIQKPLPTYDAEIGRLPAQKPCKRYKYNPHQETFVTDVSHRSRRCATFRKRRHARLDGPVNDAMLQKVQVPVEPAYSEPKVEHYADIGLDFWKELNWQLWRAQRGSESLRDENNRQMALPPAVVLRKEDFVYVLGLLETVCFREMHSMLIDVLNVHNQAEGEEAFCEICQSDVSDRHDPIVFCEGCELPVHQSCYAFAEVPKKEWYCNVCRVLGSKAQPRCRFCPLSRGTMKQTPSLRFDDLSVFEPISHEWDLNASAFNKTCSVCDLCYGTCIECIVPDCKIPFHATCGLRSGLFMFVEDSEKSKIGVRLFHFCAFHSEKARQGCDKKRMDLVLERLTAATDDPGVECYKRSRICKLESSFDRFVNWKRMAADLNLPKAVMKNVFSHWVKRRRAVGNRPLVHLAERPARKALVKRTPKAELPEDVLDEMNSDYTKSHCILDKFRNLATLSLRRERMKLQVVRLLREAFEETTTYMEQDSHLQERFMLKVANLFNEHLHGLGSGILENSRDSSIISEDHRFRPPPRPAVHQPQAVSNVHRVRGAEDPPNGQVLVHAQQNPRRVRGFVRSGSRIE
ncbi:Protein Jade-3 [Aphelenchoides fujianensis]|nr:Protein Jade-3 [Aphelenchoides fujianensis]